jgi:hypothetical protein
LGASHCINLAILPGPCQDLTILFPSNSWSCQKTGHPALGECGCCHQPLGCYEVAPKFRLIWWFNGDLNITNGDFNGDSTIKMNLWWFSDKTLWFKGIQWWLKEGSYMFWGTVSNGMCLYLFYFVLTFLGYPPRFSQGLAWVSQRSGQVECLDPVS